MKLLFPEQRYGSSLLTDHSQNRTPALFQLMTNTTKQYCRIISTISKFSNVQELYQHIFNVWICHTWLMETRGENQAGKGGDREIGSEYFYIMLKEMIEKLHCSRLVDSVSLAGRTTLLPHACGPLAGKPSPPPGDAIGCLQCK